MSALVLIRKVVDSNYFGFLNLLLNPLYWQILLVPPFPGPIVDSFLIFCSISNLNFPAFLPVIFKFDNTLAYHEFYFNFEGFF